MLHIGLHFLLPLCVALVLFYSVWRRAYAFMLVGLVIDLDHLLATPIYDPLRCSIGFHPLHSEIAIALYAVIFVLSLPHRYGLRLFAEHRQAVNFVTIGLGIHIILDSIDCFY